MHTQNVNIKTAAQESTGRWWLDTLRLDGKVTDIHSADRLRVISAAAVVRAIISEAKRLSGLYEEIYDLETVRLGIDYMESLPLAERHAFMEAAWEAGIALSYDELRARQTEYDAFQTDYVRELL